MDDLDFDLSVPDESNMDDQQSSTPSQTHDSDPSPLVNFDDSAADIFNNNDGMSFYVTSAHIYLHTD